MIDSTIAKVKGFILKPVETFQQTKDDEPKVVITYFAVLALIFSLLSAIVTTLGLSSMFADALPFAGGFFFVFIGTFIGLFISTLIFVAWLHLWVYIFGGRNGIIQTMNAVVYGYTPYLLFAWIPIIGIIFSIWALVLNVLGVRELQELSTGKTVLLFVIAIVIPMIIIVFLLGFLLVALVAVTGMDPVPENLFL